jgi:hypothetical protein
VNRREVWLSAGAVFALALVTRAVAAVAVGFPIPEDTAYYAGVARNLVEGRGLISDALWSYQTQPLTVPRAAFEVWMPLPSIIAAVPMAMAGAANWFRAAQFSSVVTSSLVAALAWRLGADVAGEMRLPVGRARTMSLGSGAVAALLGPLVIYGALPDSTAPFAVLSLAACLVMARAARGYGAHNGASYRQLVGLGALLGLAALTRSEAIWLAMAWLAIVWRGLPAHSGGAASATDGAGTPDREAIGAAEAATGEEGAATGRAGKAKAVSRASGRSPARRYERVRLVLVPGVVAVLIFAPWAIRDWLTFGSPLPGQSLNNALYIHSFDVFAYQDQPTLARYLSQGPAAIIGMHIDGLAHNLLEVLIIPAFPIGLLGLLMLPRIWRLESVRPLVVAATLTFGATCLLFPVSTQSGTFLHSAGATLVLLVVSCLAALDAFIVRVGRLRHWTRPVAWLGPAFAIAAAVPLTGVSISTLSGEADGIRARYEALPAAMARAGTPLADSGPVITNFPIWLAESAGVRTLALPQESPASVLDLARRFGAQLLVVQDDAGNVWPGALNRAGPEAACFKQVTLTDISSGGLVEGSPLAQIHVFRIVCP